MQNIYSKIIDLVKKSTFETKDKYIKFSDPNYEPFDFDNKNFHTIKNIENRNKIAFIDGGSSEILRSANFSLNLIRVYSTVYFENKRIKSEKIDFYAFTYAKDVNGEIYYETEIISQNDLIPEKDDLLMSSFDETIRNGITRASISNVANVIRRFSEIKAAINVMDNLEKNDIIVLDGSLQCTFTNEKKYFGKLYEKAEEKGIIVSGLSKTTTLMTDKGNSISNALNKFDVNGKWLYHPVAEIKASEHKAEMAFVKFHEKAKHIFRFELYKEQKKQLLDILELIAVNCKDPVFVGYPYGLIEADRNARISNNEKSMLQTFFIVKFGKDWEKIKESLSSIDAHEILDRIG